MMRCVKIGRSGFPRGILLNVCDVLAMNMPDAKEHRRGTEGVGHFCTDVEKTGRIFAGSA